MKFTPFLLFAALLIIQLCVATQAPPERKLEDSASTDDQFKFNVETHNENFKRIKENMKAIEESYIQCITDLADNDFAEETVNNCVGSDLIYVTNDVIYERKKLIGRADKKIRDYMLANCYEVAQSNEAQSNGCDLLQRDVLDLLWDELNIEATIDYHRAKYLFTYGEVPVAAFDKIIVYLKTLYEEMYELITEIDQHALLTNTNIKTAIDERTQGVLKRANESLKNPLPKIYKHTIEIQEKINEPSRVEVDQLPRAIVMDSSTQLYASHDNKYVEDFNKATNYKYTRTSGTNSINASNYGPVVTIPDRKLKLDENKAEKKDK